MTVTPQALAEQLTSGSSSTLEAYFEVIEQSMDKLAGVGLDAIKQRQMSHIQQHINLTRKFVDVNDAKMAAYHSMIAMQGHFLLHLAE